MTQEARTRKSRLTPRILVERGEAEIIFAWPMLLRRTRGREAFFPVSTVFGWRFSSPFMNMVMNGPHQPSVSFQARRRSPRSDGGEKLSLSDFKVEKVGRLPGSCNLSRAAATRVGDGRPVTLVAGPRAAAAGAAPPLSCPSLPVLARFDGEWAAGDGSEARGEEKCEHEVVFLPYETL